MFFQAVVARCQASATKCQASGATPIFLFVYKKKILDFFLVVEHKKKQRRERKKEENSSFFILLVILFFLLIGIFSLLLIPLPRPISSFMRVGSFLPYLCFSPFMLHRKGVNLEDIVMSRTLFSENYYCDIGRLIALPDLQVLKHGLQRSTKDFIFLLCLTHSRCKNT
jgi:hypothetical protein